MAKAHCMVVARDPSTGATLLSATINVYTPGTVTPIPATTYDKNNNVLTNPLTSDATTGLIDFYMSVAQEVDLTIAKTGYTTRTYSNVPVLDDAGNDLTALLTTTGDVAYASAANTPARLAIAANANQWLGALGGIPAWLGGAWTAFTPTVSQNGAITTSTATGFYTQIGKLIIATIDIVISGTGSAGSAIIIGGLPVNSQQRGGMCFGVYGRVPGAIVYSVVGNSWLSVTTFNLQSGGVASALGTTPSFATASTDVIRLTVVYEAT